MSHSQAGDFGIIERRTGLFRKHGNIYEDGLVPDLERYALVQDEPDEYKVVRTANSSERGLNVDIGGWALFLLYLQIILLNSSTTENSATSLVHLFVYSSISVIVGAHF